ncbi:hypothetical protein OH687_26710 [Burkholderia anthina]|nr:hypothetical protein OH687_26710 [Burkholderia anthina]
MRGRKAAEMAAVIAAQAVAPTNSVTEGAGAAASPGNGRKKAAPKSGFRIGRTGSGQAATRRL